MAKFSEAESQEFLAGKHVAVISVAAEDGRPPTSVPIWYGYTPGGNILINTGAGSRKAKLIEKQGKLTVVVQQEELPYKYVIVEGTVVDTVKPGPVPAREQIAARYLGEQGGKEFVASMPGEGSVLFTIRPDRWTGFDATGEM